MGLKRREEVGDVVLVICRAVMADLGHRSGLDMMLVAGRRIILKWLVVRRVVDPHRVNVRAWIDRRVGHDQNGRSAVLVLDMSRGARRRLRGRAIGVHRSRRRCCKAAFEPAPGDALEIEQIADIPAADLDRSPPDGRAACVGAAVTGEEVAT